MNQVRGKQKAAQDLSSLCIVDSNSVKQNRKRLLQSSNINESESREVLSSDHCRKEDVDKEYTKTTYASRVLGCNAAIINNTNVSQNRRGFKLGSQSYRAPRMQLQKEAVRDTKETKDYADTRTELKSSVASILSTEPKKPVSPTARIGCKIFKKRTEVETTLEDRLHPLDEDNYQSKGFSAVKLGKALSSVVSKSSACCPIMNDVDSELNCHVEIKSNFGGDSLQSTLKSTCSFSSAKTLHNQMKFDDTRWVEHFDEKQKATRKRQRKNRMEKFAELEAEYLGVKNDRTANSINEAFAMGRKYDPPVSTVPRKSLEKLVSIAVDCVEKSSEIKSDNLGVVTDFKDTYMDVSFLSESQYLPLASPSPLKTSLLQDVNEAPDDVGNVMNAPINDDHDAEVRSTIEIVKRDLTDYSVNDECEKNSALPVASPEITRPKMFVFKSIKSRQNDESSSEIKINLSEKSCDLLSAIECFESVDNASSSVAKSAEIMNEAFTGNNESERLDNHELRNDGRKLVCNSFGKNNRFKTPGQKISNTPQKLPEVIQKKLQIHKVLNLFGPKTCANGLSIADSLINRNMTNLQDYKQNLLNQAVTFSKLAIQPAHSVFYYQHLPDYLKHYTVANVRQSAENFFSRFGYLTFSGLKLLKNSLQHDKIVSKLMQTRSNNCFYIGFPAEKHIFNKFSKNDVWIIVLDRSLMTNSGIDDLSLKILLVRSMMSWPLWNGHLQVQAVAVMGGQSLDLVRGQSGSNDLTLKSVFGVNCFNSSYCVIRIAQAVNDLECVSCIQEFIPDVSCTDSFPENFPGLFGSLFNPMKNFQNDNSTKDVLIDSCNYDKAFLLAEKIGHDFHLNDNQAEALKQFCTSLCSLESSNFTTLIHGVFGSGKSYLLAVLAHFVMQLVEKDLLLDPNFSLLICSGTNVAVDNVLIKYMDISFSGRCVSDNDNMGSEDVSTFNDRTMEHVLRIGNVQKIAIPILKYSLHYDVTSDSTKQLNLRLKNENLKQKEREALLKLRRSEKHLSRENRVICAKIVGVTCASCLSPHLNPFEASVLIIDEASQLTECMTHLAISRFKPKRLVLVGDPKQLPPVLPYSTISQKLVTKDRNFSSIAMKTTLFQRLLDSGIEPILLNKQYRCHPKISRLCNELFYDANLQDAVSEADRESLLKLNDPNGTSLSNVILVNISNGVEQLNKDSSCKSFVNIAEADFCCQLVVNAVNNQNIAPSDIGVICFYRAQVSLISDKLQRALSKLGVTIFDDVTMPLVSTVDAFQGGERKMIVLCSTRTKCNNTIASFFDDRNDDTLDFFSNSNRLNVALSRAKNNFILLCNLSLIISTSAVEGNNVWLDLYELIGKHGVVYKNVQQIISLLGIKNLSL